MMRPGNRYARERGQSRTLGDLLATARRSPAARPLFPTRFETEIVTSKSVRRS